MVTPDTTRPPAGGYSKTLDLVRALSQCECCEAFKQELIQLLDTHYGLSVHLSESPGYPLLPEEADPANLDKTPPESVLGPHALILLGPANWKLAVILDPVQDGISNGRGILQRFSQHLANLYHQYKVIDLLESALKRTEARHENQPVTLSADLDKLTPRERQIVRALMEGLGNAEISIDLGISPRTVEKHFENIFRKMRVENRYQLLILIRHAPD